MHVRKYEYSRINRNVFNEKTMATIAEKMAVSLEELRKLQEQHPCVVLQGTKEIGRTHLTRLLDNGWLQEVMKGWYIAARPGAEGDTTVWYTAFWHFIAKYAGAKLGERWCLTAEQSLDLYSGKTTVPTQVIIKSPNGSNNVQKLMYGTSLLAYRSDIPEQLYQEPEYGLNLYPLAEALVYATPRYFQTEKIAARTCLAMVQDAADILKVLARNGASRRAGRIAGAFRNIGNNEMADSIVSTMKGFGYDVREEDPFEEKSRTPIVYEVSPYVTRLRLMWENMREKVIELFPEAPGRIDDVEGYLKQVDEKYSEDAYHSLSIEGYKVSPELIEKVRSGNWQPEDEDKEHKNALVARGYYQAFQAVKKTISDVLQGKNAGEAVKTDHSTWYIQMWMPFAAVGILQREDLVGYRTGQVYIRGSQHIPLNSKAVRDAMPVLFELLKNEPHPAARAVLGHFFFVFIHPYMDGNGRMGRFILNVMLASGGYNWTVIPFERRLEYMKALEKASVEGDISDFTKVIASLVR